MPLITKDFEVCDVCYYEHLLVIIRFPDGSIMRICEECIAGIILNKQKLEAELATRDETIIKLGETIDNYVKELTSANKKLAHYRAMVGRGDA